MGNDEKQLTLLGEHTQADNGPVVCLGMKFENDEARREYFRNELRGKLPELKEIEGFPIGEDEDIIALSDPPYYTACPNPWVNDFINEWEEEKIQKFKRNVDEEYHNEPFVADVSEGKYDPIYKLHPYLTKVPHKAIMRYILHYTKPGDIILDSFSGTGMTAVAAQMCSNKEAVTELGFTLKDNEIFNENEDFVSCIGERKTVLNDLSTIAGFLSYNHNVTPCRNEEQKVLGCLEDIYNENKWMFQTLHEPQDNGNVRDFKTVEDITNFLKDKKSGTVNFIAWSDVFICPSCANDIVFWDNAVVKDEGKVKEVFNCQHCGTSLKKRDLDRKFEKNYDEKLEQVTEQAIQVPVLINYSYAGKRYEKRPDSLDMKILELIQLYKILQWVPTDRLPDGDESRRNDKIGLTHVHHFYHKRNLIILSEFYSKTSTIKNGFNITKVANQITKMYRFTNQSGVWGAGGGPLSGTLYVPSLVKELNIYSQLKKAIKQYYSKRTELSRANFNISNSSSTKLKHISDSTIDYIFIDPPFGSNLMYSELNTFWESWLKVRTNNNKEAIVNKTQGKKVSDYKDLMTSCFKELYRVLKPSRWITIEFSNTSSEIWNVIQNSIQEAGFIIANVAVLDKKKGTFKVVTSTTAVKQDLVISAYKPSDKIIKTLRSETNTEDSAWTFVTQHLKYLPVFIGVKGEAQIISERTPRILFDRMVAYHIQNGLPVPISSAEFQTGVAQRFPMRDGMAFLEKQVAEYDKKRTLVKEFAQMSLFVSDENSAIEWIRQQLLKKTQTRQDLHPNYMKEIQHIAKHELLPELDDLLHQNFLSFEGDGGVPDQIASYLRRNYKDLRGLDVNDPVFIEKAMNRWYVPDPNKQADLEKLREKSLLREFNGYVEELESSKKKLKQFRTEAIRAGFKKAYSEKEFEQIVKVGDRLPEKIIQEDDKLLMYYDNACIRLGL
ncbi:DNA methyltransferase [Bacillus cereus]|uniref:DNA methyltransferase n=1 Tax=Bacillus cereus TaxID=1396 RepID=UPI000BF29246|nr:DNA methyltransferase [Bacillus cereus]PFT90556.1 DNA methylase [Bacillus cereus]PGO98626.1 DNA methylase [Bacillus cereus]